MSELWLQCLIGTVSSLTFLPAIKPFYLTCRACASTTKKASSAGSTRDESVALDSSDRADCVRNQISGGSSGRPRDALYRYEYPASPIQKTTSLREGGFAFLIAPKPIGFVVGADSLKRFGFDLADALARDAELLTYLLERMVNAVLEPVTQL